MVTALLSLGNNVCMGFGGTLGVVQLFGRVAVLETHTL